MRRGRDAFVQRWRPCQVWTPASSRLTCNCLLTATIRAKDLARRGRLARAPSAVLPSLHGRIDQERRIQPGLVGGAWPVTQLTTRHNMCVHGWIAAVGHGPEYRVCIVRVDIVIDGNNELADKGMQCKNTVERAPDLRAWDAAHEL